MAFTDGRQIPANSAISAAVNEPRVASSSRIRGSQVPAHRPIPRDLAAEDAIAELHIAIEKRGSAAL